MNQARARALRTSVAVLLVLAFALLVVRDFSLGTDLRSFLPPPETADERLLLDQVAEGPGARLLFLAIEGSGPMVLAAQSQALKSTLAGQPGIRLVANGSESIDDLPERLVASRFLLTDRFDVHPLDASVLAAALHEREADLASPAAFVLEDWLGRDPTLEVLYLAERQKPAREPRRVDEVWFEADREAALLVVEPEAAAFDAAANRALLATIESVFAAVAAGTTSVLQVNGPGAYGVRMEARIRNEANLLGFAATAGMVLLVGIAYRRAGFVLLSALPLAAAALAGIAAVTLAFGTVHGVTLAFGFTLIGVAQDYPIHLLSHLGMATPAATTVRRLWPTLLTGVASTSIAYLAFYASGVAGLQQLAVFTIAGLAAAAAATRWILPDWTRAASPVVRSPSAARLADRLAAFTRLRPIVPVVVAAAVGVLVFGPGLAFENNLARLSPLPKEWLDREVQLRRTLGSADMRHLLVVDAADRETALRLLESLEPDLGDLVAQGAIDGYEHAATLLPSVQRQAWRQSRLPHAAAAQAMLDAAVADSVFVADAFAPFLAELEEARRQPPLVPGDLAGTPFALKIDALLPSTADGRIAALVTLRGTVDAVRLGAFAERRDAVRLIDLKAASEGLVARYRDHVLDSLVIAAILLVGVIGLALRSFRRTLRVVTPMVLTTILVLAILALLGTPLSLFHLVALVLAAGLGIDYALFFEAAEHDPEDDPLPSRHALLVCAASTMMVFALLATSSLPVLHALGVTVGLGVAGNFLLALILLPARDRPARQQD